MPGILHVSWGEWVAGLFTRNHGFYLLLPLSLEFWGPKDQSSKPSVPIQWPANLKQGLRVYRVDVGFPTKTIDHCPNWLPMVLTISYIFTPKHFDLPVPVGSYELKTW